MNTGTLMDKVIKIAHRQSDQLFIANAWLQMRIEVHKA